MYTSWIYPILATSIKSKQSDDSKTILLSDLWILCGSKAIRDATPITIYPGKGCAGKDVVHFNLRLFKPRRRFIPSSFLFLSFGEKFTKREREFQRSSLHLYTWVNILKTGIIEFQRGFPRPKENDTSFKVKIYLNVYVWWLSFLYVKYYLKNCVNIKYFYVT